MNEKVSIDSVKVIGARGRVGRALSARLAEHDLLASTSDPDVVLLCVPDGAIPEAAAQVALGPWVAHVSGATSLTALEPHTRRFGLHPLQTFTHARGPEQLDGAWAAITAETADAATVGHRLAVTLGLRPFALEEQLRVLYHAGAVIASNYLVTLRRAAETLLESAGAPAAALEPLMRRTMENGFALTGPIERGDWGTVERHLAAIAESHPELEAAYRELAVLTAAQSGRKPPAHLATTGATA